jgi:hypothetical protein
MYLLACKAKRHLKVNQNTPKNKFSGWMRNSSALHRVKSVDLWSVQDHPPAALPKRLKAVNSMGD